MSSVQAALIGIKSEIIVVDNISPDASCRMVKNKFPEVILIENKENLGFSKANNQGVALAKGKYVLILNPDTVVAEDTFVKILAFAEKKQDLGIKLVSITDSRISPLYKISNVCLLCPYKGFSFFLIFA